MRCIDNVTDNFRTMRIQDCVPSQETCCFEGLFLRRLRPTEGCSPFDDDQSRLYCRIVVLSQIDA